MPTAMTRITKAVIWRINLRRSPLVGISLCGLNKLFFPMVFLCRQSHFCTLQPGYLWKIPTPRLSSLKASCRWLVNGGEYSFTAPS